MDAETLETTAIPEPLTHETSFLCGPAGVGKTWLAREIVTALPGTVLAATTGIAAVNLGEGTTINSLIGYYDTASLVEMYTSGFLTAKLGKLWRAGVRRIICDEVSMMDAQQLTVLTRALDELAGRGYILDAQLNDEVVESQGEEAGEHPWPIHLMMTGDFCQLPAVKAPFAFESPEWPRYHAHTHVLTEIKRQADRDFILALQAARRGDAETVCDYFGPRLVSTTDNQYDGPTILATNDAVSRYNALRLDQIEGVVKSFATQRWGTQRGDWKQIPDHLDLKIGALVMILANRRDALPPRRMIYANGDLGIVAHVDGQHVYVTLQRTNQTVVVEWVTRENLVPLEPGRRATLTAAGQAEKVREKFEVIGAITYLPLRIAYASTVHKAQGLSFDHVQVNTREGFFKTPSMLYVALSRARTAEGLRLIGSVDGLRQRCTIDARIRPWL